MKLRSPVFARHEAAGARMLDWGGWLGPAAFTTMEDEVAQVRRGVGVADYPFLNHQVVEGPDALQTLQRLCTRDIARCAPGRACYTLMLGDDGRAVDDGIVQRLGADRFVVSVPGLKPTLWKPLAGFFEVKRGKAWLAAEPGARVTIRELAAFTIAVQGPLCAPMLASVVDLERMPPWAVHELRFGDIPVLCLRAGYSGELGVELLVWSEFALDLWDRLMTIGRPWGVAPFGIEATMTLGFEKGFLNANDFYAGSTPIELGLDWAVALDKPSFVGRDALLARRREGVRTRLVGLTLGPGTALPAVGTPIERDGRRVGAVTNAANCPTLGFPAARGWVEVASARPGTDLRIGPAPAVVAPGYRFYDAGNARMRSPARAGTDRHC